MRFPLMALLAKGPAHGYELKQALEARLGSAYPQLNIGQIYITLARLEKAGLIRGEDVAQSGRPNKRTYELTETGHEAVASWLEAPSGEPRVRDEFFLKLALAPDTGLADPIGLINKQRRHYLNLMRAMSRLATGEEAENPYPQLLVEGAMLHLRADLDWLERCQEELE
ncbi:PadR family transcriptional regulator [Streptomyces sp. NPDC054775]